MRTQRVIADRYSLVEPLPGSATGIGWRAQDLWSGQSVVITRVPVSGLVGHELPHAYQEIANGAAPQPDEACRGWLWWAGSGRRDLDRDRRAGPVYETACSGLVGL
jgi:hypothetical protein